MLQGLRRTEMTLHFQTKPLRDAVAALQPLLSGKSSLPVLGAVEFSNVREVVDMTATNLDIWMDLMVPAKGEISPDKFRLPGKKLHDALSGITADDLKMTVEASQVVLQAGSAKLRLPLIPEPTVAIPDATWSKPILIERLQEKLKAILPFASKDPTRPVLQSVYFGKGRMEAASGKQSIRMEEPNLDANAIVPSELCQLVARMEGSVTTRFSANMVEFSGEGWVATGKLIEVVTNLWVNTDPFYKFVPVMTIRSSAAEMIEACNQAAFGQNNEIYAVRVKSHPDKLTFYTEGESRSLDRFAPTRPNTK
jgi:DNA polymerase III sliding clamp (beta) subunit (PCNA family)